MTNEKMCELIQDGSTELLPALWDSVSKFFFLQAKKWFNKYPDMCRRAGVELEDLEQESYFAFIDAVGYYKREEGLKFLTFANFPIKTRFNELLGLRYEAQTKLPLNSAINIDKPIKEELTIADTLADDTAAGAFDELEARIDTEKLHAVLESCIDRLPDIQAEAVRLRYFHGLTFEEIGKRLGVTRTVARSREADGLRNLRRGHNRQELKQWRADIIGDSCRSTGFRSWDHFRTSSVEHAVLRLDAMEKALLEKYGYL